MLKYYKENKVKSSTKEMLNSCSRKFESHFWALVWFCYRQQFKPLLQQDFEEVETLLSQLKSPPKRQVKIGVTNDVGWGCTIRVG